MTSLDVSHRRNPPPLPGAAGASWRPAPAGRRRDRRARRAGARRPDRLEGDPGRAALDLDLRAQLRLARRLGPGPPQFGAGSFLFGTAVTSFGALILATPIALGIALFLSELAPRGIRGPVTALVETLAAIPSVVIGLWGHPRPRPAPARPRQPGAPLGARLHPALRPAGTYGSNVFTAIVVLTIMILPIIASISRELFLERAARAEGGSARPRHDALGDDPRRRLPLLAGRSGRRDDPRLRPRPRRGYRRRAW